MEEERVMKRCMCKECVRKRAVEQGAQKRRERVAALVRRASKPAWVDVHGVGMRRI